MRYLDLLIKIAQYAPIVQSILDSISRDYGVKVSDLTDEQILSAFRTLDVGSFAASASQGEADARAGLPPNPPRPASMPSTTASTPAVTDSNPVVPPKT